MPVDPAKLAKLQQASATKIGGTRRAAKKVVKNVEQDDTKLQAALKKMNAEKFDGVEEANFFREDGKVLHFNRVGVQGSVQDNTFVFTGIAQEKEITQLIPNILPQLGAENLEILRKLAEDIQARGGLNAATATAAASGEDIPNLVEGETFEDDVE
ncbi:hypothetical protein BABINDRAFT_164084 [Babjeviella inositovora NRRL Y-12698]|uniref:Nascent polypeptide-associated complex subunit beta n=1 Tax=Babjeviella inositovora NRRL Y-12698 TaxID=984486 RepID=A0A1E3QX64_9ASCO|nr:uncharacterized protein BABINDRAFT_164084 [Babjeviella inositovora NRRL Y-12698]ODQ82273.1 hypothetical protein BABINDRAFT_164084 [Babjeviella inositovora NRRL Y-12698]